MEHLLAPMLHLARAAGQKILPVPVQLFLSAKYAHLQVVERFLLRIGDRFFGLQNAGQTLFALFILAYLAVSRKARSVAFFDVFVRLPVFLVPFVALQRTLRLLTTRLRREMFSIEGIGEHIWLSGGDGSFGFRAGTASNFDRATAAAKQMPQQMRSFDNFGALDNTLHNIRTQLAVLLKSALRFSRGVLRSTTKYAIGVWLSVELVFYLWFYVKKKSLNNREHVFPLVSSNTKSRKELLQWWLGTLDRAALARLNPAAAHMEETSLQLTGRGGGTGSIPMMFSLSEDEQEHVAEEIGSLPQSSSHPELYREHPADVASALDDDDVDDSSLRLIRPAPPPKTVSRALMNFRRPYETLDDGEPGGGHGGRKFARSFSVHESVNLHFQHEQHGAAGALHTSGGTTLGLKRGGHSQASQPELRRMKVASSVGADLFRTVRGFGGSHNSGGSNSSFPRSPVNTSTTSNSNLNIKNSIKNSALARDFARLRQLTSKKGVLMPYVGSVQDIQAVTKIVERDFHLKLDSSDADDIMLLDDVPEVAENEKGSSTSAVAPSSMDELQHALRRPRAQKLTHDPQHRPALPRQPESTHKPLLAATSIEERSLSTGSSHSSSPAPSGREKTSTPRIGQEGASASFGAYAKPAATSSSASSRAASHAASKGLLVGTNPSAPSSSHLPARAATFAPAVSSESVDGPMSRPYSTVRRRSHISLFTPARAFTSNGILLSRDILRVVAIHVRRALPFSLAIKLGDLSSGVLGVVSPLLKFLINMNPFFSDDLVSVLTVDLEFAVSGSRDAQGMEGILGAYEKMTETELDLMLPNSLIDLRRAEFASWFVDDFISSWADIYRPVDLRLVARSDVETWVASQFFEARRVADIKQNNEEHLELKEMAEYVISWAEVGPILSKKPMKNWLNCYTDELPVLYRPALVYLTTTLVFPLMESYFFSLPFYYKSAEMGKTVGPGRKALTGGPQGGDVEEARRLRSVPVPDKGPRDFLSRALRLCNVGFGGFDEKYRGTMRYFYRKATSPKDPPKSLYSGARSSSRSNMAMRRGSSGTVSSLCRNPSVGSLNENFEAAGGTTAAGSRRRRAFQRRRSSTLGQSSDQPNYPSPSSSKNTSKRDLQDPDFEHDLPPPRHPLPIVFAHGLGIGLLEYMQVIQGLVRTFGEEYDIFVLSLPWVSMRVYDAVPTGREVALKVNHVLSFHGYEAAHFIGHSYGTLICSWCVRHAPEMVRKLTVLDPVCFQNIKAGMNCMSGTFREPSNIVDAVIAYAAFRELFTVFAMSWIHWQDTELFPEACPPGHTLVFLQEGDSIVPVQTVRRYLSEYEPMLHTIYNPGTFHGCFLLPPFKYLLDSLLVQIAELHEKPFDAPDANTSLQGLSQLDSGGEMGA
mmetsp:Transcript_26053/g.65657  ORF Transcript_26053/g.65657 Transcript_26053/m.65657 type:complete len:1383 (+) Transcript_26053:739-4887(+)|eukprot:CAMPEP_0179006876 /NCGR_PEP_ID=MMETSP0795-20121207/14817_1 /TAXON_ID=88552 /ORGANISM="Amoebophrya sp., Strain Ameob2" /LENGTH=1382 /DNA_ID=CAMNT_0020701725 /DNA_START=662 /DNA_END=4810 /DNA_ORIENTATION=-